MLMQALEFTWIVVSVIVLAYELRENRRLRRQNEELLQLVADAAAQDTIDAESSAEMLSHLQSLRAENAALKGQQ